MGMTRLMFGVMYRVGFVPWDGHKLSVLLTGVVEGAGALPPGKALDVGCGTGDTSIYLSQHGWNVTAIDFVRLAIDRARAKTAAAGVNVRYVRGDVTQLSSLGAGSGFQLAVDNGCLHGLSDAQRDAYVRELSAAVAPGGRLILSAFTQRKRRGPSGMDQSEIERRFAAGWTLLSRVIETEASVDPADPIHVYDLQRR
jgi:2-polyprenyl-3-methyl-5-hydroxy-6-metoxy-1,4-benzoquinol methylase